MGRVGRSHVSVVIPSKNRPIEISRMLESLRGQATLPHEVVIVDQSTPRYSLDPFPGLVHLHDPSISGLTAARNRGVEHSSGDIILFFDDDVVLESDCVDRVERLFSERPDVVGAQCEIQNPWDDDRLSLYEISSKIFEHGFFQSRPTRRGRDRVPRLIDGLASAYRRTIFEFEKFDETLTGYCLAEDWDFTKRAERHGALVIVDGARVRHEPASSGRYDVQRYLETRWTNILYLYAKLGADRDPRNRFWKHWWMFGERLRLLKRTLVTRSSR